jgi:predicted aldo/keto reductase-like oxidoreductase
MDFSQPRILERTGLNVGRLGVGAGYGAPAATYEEAFEKGCNYFYWSSRKPGMRDAIKNISRQGKRDQLIIAIQSYSRSALWMETSIKKALKSLSLDYADILILGWYNRSPSRRVIDKAIDMREKGLYRFLGLSGHNRSLFPKLVEKNVFDIFHVRYNAAHRDAEKETFPFMQGDNKPGIVSYTATRWGKLLNPRKMPPGEPPLSVTDCYRFVLSNPCVDICLSGPKNSKQMREALPSLELGPMDESELMRVRKIGDHLHKK